MEPTPATIVDPQTGSLDTTAKLAALAGSGAGCSATSERGFSPRATGEFVVVLLIGILFARAFVAEAYIVPTGSMAPALLGMHRDYRCPSCGFRFELGIDEYGRGGRAVCPNCGRDEIDRAAAVECNGDRLLVQKHLFELRPPRRWEIAVFQNPAEGDEAYVKRVVGLPGESVLIREGDIYVDGRIARKSFAEQRAMRIPVYNHDFQLPDNGRSARWIFRHGPGRRPWPTGWRAEGSTFVHEMVVAGPKDIDWLAYRHWQPDQGHFGPLRDFTPYNGADLIGENRITDVWLAAELTPGTDCTGVFVRLGTGPDEFIVSLPTVAGARVRVERAGQPVAITGDRPWVNRATIKLDASWIDHRLIVALNGVPLFDPVEVDEPPTSYPSWAGPVAIGVLGGRLEVRHLALFRDVYYTSVLAGAPRRPHGVGVPYTLGKDEYFVLGDNSPVSNDSRFWSGSPVVRLERFLGKPFLVHLPSRVVPLKVMGRELYWIPDPRAIRYIR